MFFLNMYFISLTIFINPVQPFNREKVTDRETVTLAWIIISVRIHQLTPKIEILIHEVSLDVLYNRDALSLFFLYVIPIYFSFL